MRERETTPAESGEERIPGGNEPPAPRVAPELEALDRSVLESAAGYAGQHAARALLVARRGHIVCERYWHGTGFASSSDSQSFARVVAALATARAINEHRIGWLDQPAEQLLPELRGVPRGSRSIRSLLGLTSAAADFQLLGKLLERATGEGYAQYLARVLWRRVGASDAWLERDPASGAVRIGCCMRVRQGDWIRVAELLLNDGRYRGEEVVRPGFVAQLRRPLPMGGGMGFFVPLDRSPPAAREPLAAADVLMLCARGGHRMWLMPSLQLAIVRLGPMPAAGSDYDESFIPNTVANAVRDRAPAALGERDVSKIVPHH